MARDAFWQNYRYIADGIAKLFSPWVEVVIHDLKKNVIVHIAGTLSGRRAGDASLLEEGEKKWQGALLGPYRKRGPDGGELKSLSIPLHEPGTNLLRGMLCINVDISGPLQLRSMIDAFCLSLEAAPMSQHFVKDWQDRINDFVGDFIQAKGKKLDSFSRDDRRELIQSLHAHGAFAEKNAALYVARALGISRASVYSYLKLENNP